MAGRDYCSGRILGEGRLENALNRESASTPWGWDLDRRAGGVAQEGLGDRRFHGHLPLRTVALRSAHDRPNVYLTRVLVADLGGTPEGKRRPGGLGYVNDDGIAPPLPQTEDPSLQVGLILLGRVVLGVLLEVAVAAGREDPRSDSPAPNSLKFSDLCFESRKTRLGDRLAVVLGAHLAILAAPATECGTGHFRSLDPLSSRDPKCILLA
jgi:hypothetical protein